MMDGYSSLNRFSRTNGNDAKMGYFPTDPLHCKRIEQMIDFGTEEVCAVDLCAGEGDALIHVTGKAKEGRENIKLFAIELNSNRADKLKSNPHIYLGLEADTLNGAKLSHQVFSFCFANPPYGVDEGKRLEISFLERYLDVITKEGLLVLVIPYYVLNTDTFARKLLWYFTPVYMARFDDSEYAKFKQCVLFAYSKPKSNLGYKKEALEAFLEEVSDVEKLPYLPALGVPIEKKFKVVKSSEEKIEFFTTSDFDPNLANDILGKDSLSRKVINDTLTVRNYTGTKVGRPPVPLNKNLTYTCAVAGVGQGIAGSEESGDLHLQKGSVRIKETVIYVKRGKDTVEMVQSNAVTTMVTLDNNGNIKELVGEAGEIEAQDEEED